MADPLLAPALIRISDAVEYADVLVLARALVRNCAVANRHEFQRFVDGNYCTMISVRLQDATMSIIVYITSINHWVEMQHSRTIVLSRPLF